MYGLRRVTLAVTSLLLSASTIHLLNLPSETAASHLSQALGDLEAMSVNHRFAARAVDIIRQLSSKWNIALPEGAATVALYRMGGHRDSQSEPPSTFFAASIPRDHSSGGRTRSGDSSHSHQESPFPPPHQQDHQHLHGPTSMPLSFFSDPQTPLDATQAQTAFWTPFPAQVMPTPHDLTAALMDVPAFAEQHSWPPLGGSGPPHNTRHQSDPGRLDETMSGLGDWSWD